MGDAFRKPHRDGGGSNRGGDERGEHHEGCEAEE